MAVSDEVKNRLNRTLIAYELLIKKQLKSKRVYSIEVEVLNKQLNYYKTEGNYSVYFDLIYQVETEYIEDVIDVLKLIEDINFEVFKEFQFSISGHLVKRTTEPFDGDDVCCFLTKIEFGSDRMLKVTMGQEFQAYKN